MGGEVKTPTNRRATPDSELVKTLAVRVKRSPEGIADRANALTSGECGECVVGTGKFVDDHGRGRGLPFLRAVASMPNAVAAALMANVDDVQVGGGDPLFSQGDWQVLRSAVLASGAVVREEGEGYECAHLEWGDGPDHDGELRDDLTLELGPEPWLVVRTSYPNAEPEFERYVAAELDEEGPIV